MAGVNINAHRVGTQSGADGSYLYNKSDKWGNRVMTQAHGKYAEAVLRGNCYAAQTAATGVAPGTALGTTAGFCLHNPTGSGYYLIVQKIAFSYISGTLGAGTVHICSSSSGDALPTGTAITPRNLLVGSSNTSVALPFTTATITTNAAKQIGFLGSLQASLASTAVAPWLLEKDCDGEIIISPGFNITLHATAAAGSSPLGVYNCTWEEVVVV